MSNNAINTPCDNQRNTWNTTQLFTIMGTVGVLVAATLMISRMQNDGVTKDHDSHTSIVGAILEKKETFKGLPIIRIGNPEEIHTLKSSGKDGWYVWEEGNTLTYWKIQSGIIESNTYTLTQ